MTGWDDNDSRPFRNYMIQKLEASDMRTVGELAQVIAVLPESIDGWLSGRVRPSAASVRLLAVAVRAPVGEALMLAGYISGEDYLPDVP